MANISFFGSKQVGSTWASRVRVASPQGSRYSGRTGQVVETVPGTTTVMVRLGGGLVLPFDECELAAAR